jgi:3-oxoacyl-[acyl-carrier-protein] synthase-3
MSFTVAAIPQLIDEVLHDAGLKAEQVDLFLMHQATYKMLQQLQVRLGLNDERMPIQLEKVGNTVSSTLPILIRDLRTQTRLKPGTRSMLVGFGVGWSWAGCIWEEVWPPGEA